MMGRDAARLVGRWGGRMRAWGWTTECVWVRGLLWVDEMKEGGMEWEERVRGDGERSGVGEVHLSSIKWV